MADTDVLNSNSDSSHRFCETTAAICQNLDDVGVSLREKPVADLLGESSNLFDDLFAELEGWEAILKSLDE